MLALVMGQLRHQAFGLRIDAETAFGIKVAYLHATTHPHKTTKKPFSAEGEQFNGRSWSEEVVTSDLDLLQRQVQTGPLVLKVLTLQILFNFVKKIKLLMLLFIVL